MTSESAARSHASDACTRALECNANACRSKHNERIAAIALYSDAIDAIDTIDTIDTIECSLSSIELIIAH